jgi:hypothetical protein
VVVKADSADACPLLVADPLPFGWSLIEEILSPKRELCAVAKNKNATPLRRGCGRETNGVRLFSLPYAGITQVRF